MKNLSDITSSLIEIEARITGGRKMISRGQNILNVGQLESGDLVNEAINGWLDQYHTEIAICRVLSKGMGGKPTPATLQKRAQWAARVHKGLRYKNLTPTQLSTLARIPSETERRDTAILCSVMKWKTRTLQAYVAQLPSVKASRRRFTCAHCGQKNYVEPDWTIRAGLVEGDARLLTYCNPQCAIEGLWKRTEHYQAAA